MVDQRRWLSENPGNGVALIGMWRDLLRQTRQGKVLTVVAGRDERTEALVVLGDKAVTAFLVSEDPALKLLTNLGALGLGGEGCFGVEGPVLVVDHDRA